MMSISTRHRYLSLSAMVCFSTLLALPAPARAQRAIQPIVVFGDSLSDTGNAFTFTKASSTPPDFGLDALLVPSYPYARGGHHFTNGATWIEQLARPLGSSRSVQPAFASANPYAMNFAIATVRARQDGVNPSLSFLVSTFLERTGGVAPSDALYVIEVGGNDVRDALVVAQAGGNPLPILQATATAIANNIATLYAAGARKFLVWNVPDVGLTPAVRLIDAQFPGAAAGATLLTKTYDNLYFAPALASVSGLPGIALVPFDAFALITAIAADPAAFGLVNVTAPCVTPDDPPFTCERPDLYLFWDGIHPTTAVHAIIAAQAAHLLGL